MMKKLILLIAVTTLVGCGQKAPQVQPDAKTRPVSAGSTSAELSTLEKKHPDAFVNSLGMVFRPVPGTEVQFCIWETRVKDYAEYAEANTGVDDNWKRPIRNSPFTQTDMHPVVRVDWNDAQAFCAWLTKKEMAEGKIKAGQKYRLPTDAEWSVAVGLGKEEGNTPRAKSGGIKDVYPWGQQWPPPKEAGNYHGSLGVDGFEFTSPVGSFAVNKYGIHDLGGNAEEWCEDLWDPAAKNYRVKRGSHYGAFFAGPNILSSRRVNIPYDWRSIFSGFRCVLAGE